MDEEIKEHAVILPTVLDIKYVGSGKVMSTLWWLLLVVTILTTAIFFIKLGNGLFSRFIYTYDFPSATPGSLTDSRFSFYYWLLVVSLCLDVMMLIFAFTRIFIPWDNTVGIIHIIFSAMVLVVEFIFLIEILIVANNCNSDAFTPCASDLFCVVNAVPNSILTPPSCPIPTGPYSISINPDDLTWNSIFKNNLGFTITMAFLGLVHLIIGAIVQVKYKDIFYENTKVLVDEEEIRLTAKKPVEQIKIEPKPKVRIKTGTRHGAKGL